MRTTSTAKKSASHGACDEKCGVLRVFVAIAHVAQGQSISILTLSTVLASSALISEMAQLSLSSLSSSMALQKCSNMSDIAVEWRKK